MEPRTGAAGETATVPDACRSAAGPPKARARKASACSSTKYRNASVAGDACLLCRPEPPHFANARSVRNALDGTRLRQASRLYADRTRELDARTLSTIEPPDILASRVFATPRP